MSWLRKYFRFIKRKWLRTRKDANIKILEENYFMEVLNIQKYVDTYVKCILYTRKSSSSKKKGILTILTFYSGNTTRLYLSLSQSLIFWQLRKLTGIRTNLPKKTDSCKTAATNKIIRIWTKLLESLYATIF